MREIRLSILGLFVPSIAFASGQDQFVDRFLVVNFILTFVVGYLLRRKYFFRNRQNGVNREMVFFLFELLTCSLAVWCAFLMRGEHKTTASVAIFPIFILGSTLQSAVIPQETTPSRSVEHQAMAILYPFLFLGIGALVVILFFAFAAVCEAFGFKL